MVLEVSDLPIQRIAYETMSQRVYGELRELIMSGRVQPGQRLTLKNLAEAVGTSHMPVREALRQLATEGALEFLPNKSVRVPIMTETKFREILEIRKLVEGLAVERATEIIDAEALNELSTHNERFKSEVKQKQPDATIAIEANMRFHFTVYRAAQMPTLMNIIEGLWLQIGPVLNLDMRSGSSRLTEGPAQHHHQRVLDAMKKRDPKAAREALLEDLTTAANFILSLGKLA